MTKDDTAVFHAFAWNPVKAEYDEGAWERERLLRRAALKLKDPCITARRNGLMTDGWTSRKAANIAERVAA